ncbi:MAG: hypothetical protein FWF02_04935 [Micrococcales bacterium]|nr:hypothetical protein [Micrococcales bacterium]MCL2667038.1 hypothetical protein [Micrococcales bacterium]
MLIDWTDEFEQMLNRLDEQVEAGDADAAFTRRMVMLQLRVLQGLDSEPVEESAELKPVQQSRDHLVWRLSHPYVEGKAVRTIVWFADRDHVVVALFANDKAQMGDVFYSSVGTRADQLIDKYLHQREAEER